MATPQRRRHNGCVSIARLSFLSVALLGVCGACRLGAVPEPIPFRGAGPTKILVWPMVAAEFAAQQPLLWTGLDQAVRRRGYPVVTSAVAMQLLVVDGALPDAADGAAIRAATGADAVLRLFVHAFRTEGDRPHLADWDLGWELTSTVTGAVTWEFAHHGHWERRAPIDPHPPRGLDEEGPPVMFGDRPQDFRDAVELVAWLHRFAMEHLPHGAP